MDFLAPDSTLLAGLRKHWMDWVCSKPLVHTRNHTKTRPHPHTSWEARRVRVVFRRQGARAVRAWVRRATSSGRYSVPRGSGGRPARATIACRYHGCPLSACPRICCVVFSVGSALKTPNHPKITNPKINRGSKAVGTACGGSSAVDVQIPHRT